MWFLLKGNFKCRIDDEVLYVGFCGIDDSFREY